MEKETKKAQENQEQTFVNGLTKLENMYWMMIRANGAVPYIKGRPGEAKTAILRTIAKKLGLQYIDIRLSQVDEAVVTGFPATNPDGQTFSFRTPDWAVKANSQPTIICFEEYNRAKLEQRNAAMQIMCEKEVGMNFKFNENVYMVATGNLGEEDGTDVEEIEAAQRNRMATIKHTLTIKDWEIGYAKENVHPLVLGFINASPSYFYKAEPDADSFATPRSWDNLSKFIKSNFGTKREVTQTLVDTLTLCGKAYVGSSILPLLRYLETVKQISVQDILNSYDEVREVVQNFSRPQISEMIVNLQEIVINELTPEELENLISFMSDIKDDDEIIKFFKHIIQQTNIDEPTKNVNIFKIRDRFPDKIKRMKELIGIPSK